MAREAVIAYRDTVNCLKTLEAYIEQRERLMAEYLLIRRENIQTVESLAAMLKGIKPTRIAPPTVTHLELKHTGDNHEYRITSR